MSGQRTPAAATTGKDTAAAARAGGATIAVCMIVKNEAAVIGRCIASVRDLIDAWVIVDTGSTDGTPELVESLLGDLPGGLHAAPWRDFGANRSELLELARGRADYLLLLDADMTVSRRGPLPRLDCDAYLIEHEGEPAYWVPRLVRADLPWRYVGATHEYLTCGSDFATARLSALAVVHHGDGGSRADKLTRDLDLLSRQLRATPEDPRTLFYLAQTWRDLGDPVRAADLYARRAQLPGFEEESFYAAFQHGLLVADADWPRGKELLADAWERRPQRIEPLYEIAVRARQRGEFAVADWATELGVGCPMPEDILFVHRFVYQWGMRLERSIACAHRGQIGAALALTGELLGEHDLPDPVREALETNRTWLENQEPFRPVRSPETLRLPELCRGTVLAPLALGRTLPDTARTAASIVRDEDGFSCVVQFGSCASQSGDRPGADGHALGPTAVLVALGEDLRVTREVELCRSDPPHFSCVAEALEDFRLFSWNKRRFALATRHDPGSGGGHREVLVCLDGGHCAVIAPLGDPVSQADLRPVPLLFDEVLLVVDSFRPFRVLRFDESRRRLEPVLTAATDCRFAGLRGASPGLRVDDGYLFVVRQEVRDGTRRRHLHRFVSVDGTLAPSGISRPFSILGHDLEHCAGVAAWRDAVVLSAGAGSRTALAVVPLDAVVSAIEPVV